MFSLFFLHCHIIVVSMCMTSAGFVRVLKIHESPRFLVVKMMYFNVLNFPETVEKSIKVHKTCLAVDKKVCVLFAAKQ